MPSSIADWFDCFDPWAKARDLRRVLALLRDGHLDVQDEWGMTGLHLAVACHWIEAVHALLKAGADTELRYHRTGETALYTAVQEKDEASVKALLDAGANPDAANYWGKTPREWAGTRGLAGLFARVPKAAPVWPEPRIQNAEHLADHHHPRFKIPDREEREALVVSQAVDIHVHGPKSPAVKVRIDERKGKGPKVRYHARLDPPDQETNLASGTTEVTFGPEHVASVYIARPAHRGKRKS